MPSNVKLGKNNHAGTVEIRGYPAAPRPCTLGTRAQPTGQDRVDVVEID